MSKLPDWATSTVALPDEVEPSPQAIAVVRVDAVTIVASSTVTVPSKAEKLDCAGSEMFAAVAPVILAASACRTGPASNKLKLITAQISTGHRPSRPTIDRHERIAVLHKPGSLYR